MFLDQKKTLWSAASDETLLKLRFGSLKLRIEDTPLMDYVEKLYDELEKKGLKYFKPHVWFSDEWFTPDGVPGIAVPFYLGHKRLAKLEESQIYEVEGGAPRSFMKLLRHECGHAIDNAYQLRRRRKRQSIFGNSTEKYDDYYSAKPFSRKFVIHLDSWYSQSHPDEDFAETFAVWLTPRSKWRTRYQGWGAYKKLEYIDELMSEIGSNRPLVRNKIRDHSLSSIRKTLGHHYEQKREHYGSEIPDFYDQDLLRIFATSDESPDAVRAAVFIRGIRREVRRLVGRWTGAYQYTIDQVIFEIIDRCEELKLRMKSDTESSKNNFLVMLTLQTVNHLNTGNHRLVR